MSNFPCPQCAEKTCTVMDSRLRVDGTRWRRRLCRDCGNRFSTLEAFMHSGGRGHAQHPAEFLRAIRIELIELRDHADRLIRIMGNTK